MKVSIVSPKPGVAGWNERIFSTLIAVEDTTIFIHHLVSSGRTGSLNKEFQDKFLITLKEKK